MEHSAYDSVTIRQDLPDLEIDEEQLIRVRKLSARFASVARAEAKPEECCLCGDKSGKLCNSHTVPQYCLREIAVAGKLYISSAFFEGNILDSEVGLKQAATFRRICRKCDSEYFKHYETPASLLNGPTSQALGQIAAKSLLREIDKAMYQVELVKALGSRASMEFSLMGEIRKNDLEEDKRNLKKAIKIGRSIKPSNAYQLILYSVLPYVVPVAFQQQISPISDFEGGLINNVYNSNPAYRVEPLYVAILPSRGKTVVLVFRNKEAKRYRAFEKQMRAASEREQLQAILKMLFAYSDDVLLSKRIPNEFLNNKALRDLARMNHGYLHLTNEEKGAKLKILEKARSDFAIENLPDPPELLMPNYAIA